jgi:hypothetical protein
MTNKKTNYSHMNTSQNTDTCFMVRPASFGFNPETATNNTFQQNIAESQKSITYKVLNEFDTFVKQLQENNVAVHVMHDSKTPIKPDAIFPNNWISLHSNNTLVLYPMFAKNRRLERSKNIIDYLKTNFKITEVIDFTDYENKQQIVEGTGSIVFDHNHKLAYACLSPRTDKKLFIQICERLNYKPIYFTSVDEKKVPVYHTNVVMSVGDELVIICLESIINEDERKKVAQQIIDSGKVLVDISLAQMGKFAGNMIQLKNQKGQKQMVMSQTAFNSLLPKQIAEIEKENNIIKANIPTIETIGGGSARCMIAEIFCSQN